MIAQNEFAESPAVSVAPSTLPRVGSSMHYALLRLDEVMRTKLLHTLDLLQSISGCIADVQEPPVAQTKLQWWNDEIGRLALGEARHPATQRCQAWLSNNPLAETQLLAVLDAATAARFDTPEDDEAWQSLLPRDYAARLHLVTTALTGEPAREHLFDKAAMSAAWVDILRTLPRRIHHDQIALPPSMYERYELSRKLLQSHVRVAGRDTRAPDPDEHKVLKQLFYSAVTEALEVTDQAIGSDVYRYWREHPNTRCITTGLQLRRAQLALWKKAQPDLLKETMTLTPLRKWYIAFRNR